MRRLPSELGFSISPDIKMNRILSAGLGFIDHAQLTAARAYQQRNVITAVPTFRTRFDQQNEAMDMSIIRRTSQTTMNLESLGMNHSLSRLKVSTIDNTSILEKEESLSTLPSSFKRLRRSIGSPFGKEKNLAKKSSSSSLACMVRFFWHRLFVIFQN
jgi:hypothetical protein